MRKCKFQNVNIQKNFRRNFHTILSIKLMNTCLIYQQMCKLTSSFKHLRLRFVKHLRNLPLVCLQGWKCRNIAFWQDLYNRDAGSKTWVFSNVKYSKIVNSNIVKFQSYKTFVIICLGEVTFSKKWQLWWKCRKDSLIEQTKIDLNQ